MENLDNVSYKIGNMIEWAESDFSDPLSGQISDISNQIKNKVDYMNMGAETITQAIVELEEVRKEFEQFLKLNLNEVIVTDPVDTSSSSGNGSDDGSDDYFGFDSDDGSNDDDVKKLVPYKSIPGSGGGRHR